MSGLRYCVCGHAEMFHYGIGCGCKDKTHNYNFTASIRCTCERFQEAR